MLCYRCNNHVSKSNTSVPPSKAYWNSKEPGPIPRVILRLSQTEKRLLSRIIPFLKIVKFDGLFRQYGFCGQAVLFAQGLFEVTEKLPHLLPRSVDNCGIVIVTEHLENLNITREFSVSRDNVFEALTCLVANNLLYKDVLIDNNANLSTDDLILVSENACSTSQTIVQSAVQNNQDFVQINDVSRILHASWHQRNVEVFTSGYTGVQCCAMEMSNIIRVYVTPQLSSGAKTLL
ncbi:ATP-dependent DNA helicase [Trichonephila clavipes]|nr:ATP-dependent DNA helicase [Trichonephila clavipes]